MSKHRRIRPYAWLGTAAVTLGLGAGMVGGTAVAVADVGADAGSSHNSTSEGTPPEGTPPAGTTSAGTTSGSAASESTVRGATPRQSRAVAGRANKVSAPVKVVGARLGRGQFVGARGRCRGYGAAHKRGPHTA